MYFDETNKQWISTRSDVLKFGEILKDEVIHQGKDIIPAGTIMVFALSGKAHLMFQTLQDLALSSARNTTLVYCEMGSIVFLDTKGGYIPTLTFRNCRFPTIDEFERYERYNTV